MAPLLRNIVATGCDSGAAVSSSFRESSGGFPSQSRTIPVLLLLTLAVAATGLAARPNILLIVVDDLNDWISPLGGHPQSQTPNLDALAGQSVLFTRAYAAAPLCIPSRRALLSGQAEYNPYREDLRRAVTIPEAFSAAGWWSAGVSKIFHAQQHGSKWDEFKRIPPDVRKKRNARGKAVPDVGNLNWGPAAIPRERMPDFKAASWVKERLLDVNFREPFFVGLGIYRPHLPWIVPEEYFQRFGRTDFIQLPEVFDQDVSDVPDAGRNLDSNPDRREHHRRIEEAEKDKGAWKAGVQAYLASVSFADDCAPRRRARRAEALRAAVLRKRWREVLRSRRAGGGCKPPTAAAFKRRGGERARKRQDVDSVRYGSWSRTQVNR